MRTLFGRFLRGATGALLVVASSDWVFAKEPAPEADRAEPAASVYTFDVPACDVELSIWARAKQSSDAERYCFLLGQARANLRARPEVAEKAIAEAQAIVPQSAHLALMRAYLLSKAQDFGPANELFSQVEVAYAKESSTGKVENIRFGCEYWLAAARSALSEYERRSAALRYRQAVLRLFEEQSPSKQAIVLVEAATASLYDGPSGLDEARSYLKRAEKLNAPLLRPLVSAATLLLQERSELFGAGGFKSKVSLVPVEIEALRTLLDTPESHQIHLPPGEKAALMSAALRPTSPEEAAAYAQTFYASCPPAHLLSDEQAKQPCRQQSDPTKDEER